MPEIRSKLLKLLTEKGTCERCGVVTKRGKVVELTNAHPSPTEGFMMQPQDVLEWLASGEAKATWHTHPGADPNLSEEDYRGFSQWPDVDHWVVGLRDGQPSAVCYYVENGLVVTR